MAKTAPRTTVRFSPQEPCTITHDEYFQRPSHEPVQLPDAHTIVIPGEVEKTLDRVRKFRHPLFCECAICATCIDCSNEMSDLFWVEARISKLGHKLGFEMVSYETNHYICTRCGRRLVENNATVSRKLADLMPNYQRSNFSLPNIFVPFAESCNKCQAKIGTEETFIIIGTSEGEIDYDHASGNAIFSIYQHIPIFAFCEKCGSKMFGDKLFKILKLN